MYNIIVSHRSLIYEVEVESLDKRKLIKYLYSHGKCNDHYLLSETINWYNF